MGGPTSDYQKVQAYFIGHLPDLEQHHLRQKRITVACSLSRARLSERDALQYREVAAWYRLSRRQRPRPAHRPLWPHSAPWCRSRGGCLWSGILSGELGGDPEDPEDLHHTCLRRHYRPHSLWYPLLSPPVRAGRSRDRGVIERVKSPVCSDVRC